MIILEMFDTEDGVRIQCSCGKILHFYYGSLYTCEGCNKSYNIIATVIEVE